MRESEALPSATRIWNDPVSSLPATTQTRSLRILMVATESPPVKEER